MSVVAVVVTYHPPLDRLFSLLAALEEQTTLTIIVDNGSSPVALRELEERVIAKVHIIALGHNHGIAAAQNIGISRARQAGASHILFLDQDSIPPAGMSNGLCDHINALETAGVRVAAVGPRRRDDRSNSIERLPATDLAAELNNVLEADYLIASGSMVPIGVIEAVGGMREELFIDYVDIEWCLRARRAGYRCFIATDLMMDHQLGTPMRALGRTISTHSPMRHYYMVRNTVWLARQKWLPHHWRRRKLPKIGLHLLLNAVFARPHLAHWRMMARGIFDGVRGREGKGHEEHQG